MFLAVTHGVDYSEGVGLRVNSSLLVRSFGSIVSFKSLTYIFLIKEGSISGWDEIVDFTRGV